jgi:uncharacterized protein
MKILAKILLLVAAVGLLSCLLSPPAYWLGRAIADADIMPLLKGVKFASYFNRTIMVLGLLSVWPLLRWFGARRWTDLMLEPNSRRFTDLGTGVVIGGGGFAYTLSLLFLGGIVQFNSILPWAGAWTLVVTAIAVPLIEESFFRGVLLSLLRRSLKWPWALTLLSCFFAILHFLGPQPGKPRVSGNFWYSGFEHVGKLFWQFGEPRLVLGGWLTLFLVGWILGYTVVRTRSLYLAIGLHGGWVLAMRFYDEFCHRAVKDDVWIGRDVRVGLAAVLLLLATLGLIHLMLKRRPSTAGPAVQGGSVAPAVGAPPAEASS